MGFFFPSVTYDVSRPVTYTLNLALKANMGRDEKDLEAWLDTSGGTEAEPLPIDTPTNADQLSDLRNAVVNTPLNYRKIDLVPVARFQRTILKCFGFMVLIIPVVVIPELQQNAFFIVPAVLIGIGCAVISTVCHFRLAFALEKAGAPVGLFTAIFRSRSIMKHATQILQAHGFKVGLLGVNPKLVEEAQKDGLLNIINQASRAKGA